MVENEIRKLLENIIPINNCFGQDNDLKVKIIDLDKHGRFFKSEIIANKRWQHCFDIGEIINWHIVSEYGDMLIFEAESKGKHKKTSTGAQSLCYIYTDSKIVSFERDS